MSKSKEGLSGWHDQQITDVARKTLDEGNPINALELVSKISSFRPSALITLMIIALVKQDDSDVCREALRLFWEQVNQCPKVTTLIPAALWLQHPRGTFLSPGFSQALAARRRQLEPGWNGTWENPGLAQAAILELKDKHPDQVHDTGVCLALAAQSGCWQKWMKRYEDLGGNTDDPKYLKIYISKFFSSAKLKLPPEVKQKLRRYVEVVEEKSARAFLRRLTPTRPSLKGRKFNRSLAQSAMFVFVSSSNLRLDPEDWVHVAAAAFHVGDENIQRIILRTLFEMDRTPAMQTVFEQLIKLHGLPNPRITALEELRYRIYNPIWEQLIASTPVDANARMILARYSESWLR